MAIRNDNKIKTFSAEGKLKRNPHQQTYVKRNAKGGPYKRGKCETSGIQE